MTPEQMFSLAGSTVMVGWIILIFLPRKIKPLFFIPQYLIPFGLGLLYSGLALTSFFVTDGGYNTLAGVRQLLSNDTMLLAGWVHYLAFDLFIGAWIAQKADSIGVPRLIQIPILGATFFFGPVGLVLFLGIHAGLIKKQRALNV